MPVTIVLPSFSGLGVKMGVKLRLTLRVMRGDAALGLLSWGGAPGWLLVLTCCACGRRGWRRRGADDHARVHHHLLQYRLCPPPRPRPCLQCAQWLADRCAVTLQLSVARGWHVAR